MPFVSLMIAAAAAGSEKEQQENEQRPRKQVSALGCVYEENRVERSAPVA
jgi:hypothetical protein